jgi:hypothetical protein
MQERQVEHGSLLRAVRRRPLARFGAVLALFAYIVAGLSPLWGPTAERNGIEVCTANGLRLIPADPPSSDAPSDKQNAKNDCPLCRILAGFLLPSAADAVHSVAFFKPAVVWLDSCCEIGSSFRGFDRRSRAPPVLS